MRSEWSGIGVSPGIAVGAARVLAPDVLPLVPEPLPAARIDDEIERFRRARQTAREELIKLRNRIEHALGPAYTGILDAQISILDDPGLVDDTIRRVRDERVDVRWALRGVVDSYTQRFNAVEDPYLRERGGDLHDIHRRLQRLLAGQESATVDLPAGPAIVVAHHLGPADAAALAEQGVLGLATNVGGRTSHTAILAQALGVPAVAGLHDLTRRVTEGEIVLLDGFTGRLIVSPTDEEYENGLERARRWSADQAQSDLPRAAGRVTTFDGVEVVLRANVELPHEAAQLRRFGSRGVGLYRSEFLFLAHAPDLPTEEQHLATYRTFAAAAAPDPVVIRTFDLGGEKYFHEVLAGGEPNPVMGLRGVRLCLARPDIFRPQLRALLRIAAEYPVKAMLPLVTEVGEIHRVRRLLSEESARLAAAGIAHDPALALGVMIEVPAAAADADTLAREADFMSLGTNDLIQFALAVDRGNESVQRLYQPLHRGVLRLLRFVVEAAGDHDVPLSICGEMAADPTLTEWLIGLGLREFSMQPRALATIRSRLATIDTTRARERVESALAPARGPSHHERIHS